ncbi:MAG: alpha/beta fold hydrolase [Caulobacteraceae bacterium]|nr:alpha/beta fold hydrolase [Caulobacteraceae bacterium]
MRSPSILILALCAGLLAMGPTHAAPTLAAPTQAAPAPAPPPVDLPPPAIYTDPAPDPAHPARMEVLHIPSHGVNINGVAYLASGAGEHPTLILLHGLPGNEKNLDLAQAVRRAGWNVVTFNYRGSWGSPGAFRFGQTLEDADSVLAYVRDPANAKALGVDVHHLVIAGHSMGGWVAVNTAAHDKGLVGVISISAGDMARLGAAPLAFREKEMAGDMESLAGVTAQSMAQDVASPAVTQYPMPKAAPGLVHTPYLAMTSDDGLGQDTDALVAAIRAQGGTQATTVHAPTDHAWSDRRIALESLIVLWLQGVK